MKSRKTCTQEQCCTSIRVKRERLLTPICVQKMFLLLSFHPTQIINISPRSLLPSLHTMLFFGGAGTLSLGSNKFRRSGRIFVSFPLF